MASENIEIYHYQNPEIKSFLTQEAISPPLVEYFKKPFHQESENALKHLGVIGAQIVREIMVIAGVKEIRIKPKEIRMKKEEWSAWEDIEGQVIAILKRSLRKKKIRVIKG